MYVQNYLAGRERQNLVVRDSASLVVLPLNSRSLGIVRVAQWVESFYVLWEDVLQVC